MPSLLSISPHADFWAVAARHVYAEQLSLLNLEVIVPTFAHVQCLRQALVAQAGAVMLAPRIHTLDAWLALQTQHEAFNRRSNSQRLMALYAELREHGWLRNLFSASEPLDLLPLANTLLDLSDELSAGFLPALLSNMPLETSLADVAKLQHEQVRWQQALQQLAPPVRLLLSEEAQLVWSIWKAQVDADDPALLRQQNLFNLAQQARRPLLWIHPVAPDAFEDRFLALYARRQRVRIITLDWRREALAPVVQQAWPEMLEVDTNLPPGYESGDESASKVAALPGVALCPAAGLEQEAQQGAQCLLDWLRAGKSRIAIIAQDRVVARRIRALMERAQVAVADETGWKLSTTRAAAAVAAWFEVVSSQAEAIALLDLLKSPFVWPAMPDKDKWLMALEAALRRQNVAAGWSAVQAALPAGLDAAPLKCLVQQAELFIGQKTVTEWSELTEQTLEMLGIRSALAQDMAGQQVLILLADIAQGCHNLPPAFHFSEWRACLSLQMEATAFMPENLDQRVVMLPLNGARLRRFDAVLMVGCDARGLPSNAPEVLFFANAVRRELGLSTRELRAQQQMRDFTEILTSGAQVVLSWQQFKNGEPNACCPWLERLQLVLARTGVPLMPEVSMTPASHTLQAQPTAYAIPAAAALMPQQLSASGYQRFLGCPYAFFASHMLGLYAWDEFSDLPEKRDYGDWLHGILHDFHEALRNTPSPAREAREILLSQISAKRFEQELRHSAAALGYYARWQKVMPAYLVWAETHEANGWEYVAGEQAYQRMLYWEGGQIMLRGRIDRIDRHADGRCAVLDYKTSSQAVLKQKLKGEDQQLAFYGLLMQAGERADAGQNPQSPQNPQNIVSEAALVGLEVTKQQIAAVFAEQYEHWVPQLEQHISFSMQALRQGAPLPANGVEEVCQYCDKRGLCRKGAW